MTRLPRPRPRGGGAVVGVGHLEPAVGPAQGMEPDAGEGGGVPEGRRAEKDGADDPEGGGDGGDAEGEGERAAREAGEVAPEPAQGATEVEGCHGWCPKGRCGFRADLL